MKRSVIAMILAGSMVLQAGLYANAEEMLTEEYGVVTEEADPVSETGVTDETNAAHESDAVAETNAGEETNVVKETNVTEEAGATEEPDAVTEAVPTDVVNPANEEILMGETEFISGEELVLEEDESGEDETVVAETELPANYFIESVEVIDTIPAMAGTEASGEIAINYDNFPDSDFRELLKNVEYDLDQNGSLSQEERDAVKTLNLEGLDIFSLQGLEYFTELTSLDCSNNRLTELDISNCTKLEYLNCGFNVTLSKLNLGPNKSLNQLYCSNNCITELDLSNYTKLDTLSCGSNDMTRLNVRGCTALVHLDCAFNELTDLNISDCTELVWLNCEYNNLNELDVSHCTKLEYLRCASNNLTELDTHAIPELQHLICIYNNLEKLDVSGLLKLEYLECSYNNLKELDVTGLLLLETVYCAGNHLTKLNLNDNLYGVYCAENSLTVPGDSLSWTTSGTWQFNMLELIGEEDIGKVELTTEGAVLSGGIVTFTDSSRPESLTYNYSMGDGYNRKMSVTLFFESAETPVHTHSWGSGVVTKAATCVAEGVRTYTCQTCGATRTETIAKTSSHAWGSAVVTKAATCASTGVRTYTCRDCGTTRTETIAKITSHTWGNWTTVSAATVFAPETQRRVCSLCGTAETRTYGTKLTPTATVTAQSVPLKLKQSTTKLKVSGLAAGDYVVSWKSSNTSVVKVNSSGKLTAGNKTGKAVVTATLVSGKKVNIKVTTQKNAVKTTKITGLSKKVKLEKGKKTTLKPVITPITSTDKVTYSSSNKKVATVSSKGVVTAKKSGTAKITVKSGSKKFVVTVTVPKTATQEIRNVPETVTIKKGKTYTLKAKRYPSNSEEKLTYKSSNSKVATVNANGKITAKKKGTAIITVKSGKKTVKCKVTVK